jgi:hypothetical protein
MTAAPIHYFVSAQKFSGLFCHTLQSAAYRTALAPFLAAAHTVNMDMQRDARSRLLYDIIGPAITVGAWATLSRQKEITIAKTTQKIKQCKRIPVSLASMRSRPSPAY